jgi:holliday junction DNA helicase RuvA
MIGFLNGCLAGSHKSGNRAQVWLEVQGVGYEVQVPAQFLTQLPDLGARLKVFTHLQVREDQWLLYGFASAAERDLFRQLIAVSGIGPQLAIALLDTLSLSELVQAIVSGNTRLLSRTPGVGNKTAERIALELRNRLAEWREQSGLQIAPAATPIAAVQEDVELTLLALGYSAQEIQQALTVVGQTTALAKTADPEAWIREAIAWLSQAGV